MRSYAIATLALLAALQCAVAADDSAILIVQKTVHSPLPGMWFQDGRAVLAQGQNFTVQITARNIGKK
jgi:hypothetical protein